MPKPILRQDVLKIDDLKDKLVEESNLNSLEESLNQKNKAKANKKKVCHSNIPNYESNYISKIGISSPYQSLKINFDRQNESTRHLRRDQNNIKINSRGGGQKNNVVGISRGNLDRGNLDKDNFDYSTPSNMISPRSRRNKQERKHHHQKNNSMGKIYDQKASELMNKYFPNNYFDIN